MVLKNFCILAIIDTVIMMAGKTSCEFCAYYNYNEAYDDYECAVNLDEERAS